jgi:hypothetical protein
VSFGGNSLFPSNKLQPVTERGVKQVGNPTGVKSLLAQAFTGFGGTKADVEPTESGVASALKSLIMKIGTPGSDLSGEIPLGLDFESEEFKTSDFWKLMFGKAPAGATVPEITPAFIQYAGPALKQMSLAP